MPPVQDEIVRRRLSSGPVVPIRCGGWRAELRGDELADISYDGVLLVRAIRPVVRDRDWNTVGVRVVSHEAGAASQTVELAFEAEGIACTGRLTLRWASEELTVQFDGRAQSTFERNRIGLVILHPADEAGEPVDVHHPDGSVDAARWPISISPHQPFRDVSGFGWVRDGVRAELELSGDVFETEDQRNWTDNSFKTYSTPLDRPFPVAVTAGDEIRQRVRLTATGRRHSPIAAAPNRVVITDEIVGTVPALALGAYVFPGSEVPRPPSRCSAVLLELSGPPDDWGRQVTLARQDAARAGCGLDVRVITADPEQIGPALDLLAGDAVRLAVFDPDQHMTTAGLWSQLLTETRGRGSSAELVAGTRAHFAELNRQFKQLPRDAPALTFSLTPQMHASEIPHLVDSLCAQRVVAANAVRLAGGRPLHIGPITLDRRFNAVTTSGRTDPAAAATAAIDPLLGTDFAAAWTLGSVAALTVPGVHTLSYFETHGPRGVRDATGDRPVGAVLDWLSARSGRPVLRASAPPGLAVYPVVADHDRVNVAVSNLCVAAVEVEVLIPNAAEVLWLEPWSVICRSL